MSYASQPALTATVISIVVVDTLVVVIIIVVALVVVVVAAVVVHITWTWRNILSLISPS